MIAPAQDDAEFGIELCAVPAVVENAGINVLTSCSGGTCWTCETEVLEGQIDHRDAVLRR